MGRSRYRLYHDLGFSRFLASLIPSSEFSICLRVILGIHGWPCASNQTKKRIFVRDRLTTRMRQSTLRVEVGPRQRSFCFTHARRSTRRNHVRLVRFLLVVGVTSSLFAGSSLWALGKRLAMFWLPPTIFPTLIFLALVRSPRLRCLLQRNGGIGFTAFSSALR